MENLKFGEIYHITDNRYPDRKIIYKHEKMSDQVRGFGYYISDINTGDFEFKKSTPSLKDRDIKKATELESEWLKYCIKNNIYVSYHDFMMDYKHKLTGRKVRALIDNPYSGTVPKGEIGVIISTSGYIYVDFPSQQGYLLNEDIDESKIELLPDVFKVKPKEHKCCVKITKENAYQLNLFLELNKDKYDGYCGNWEVSEFSEGRFFHFPAYKSSFGYFHTSETRYYSEVTLEELYEKAGYKPFEKKPVEIKAVLEEMAFRVKDHKKEQKDNRLIQLKIRDKSVTTTTQQRVRLRIIKPSLITIKN